MNIEEIIIAKKQLQLDIQLKLKSFEQKIGLKIDNIKMDRTYLIGSNNDVIDIPIKIDIEVKLP
jgi:hypothetical protein